MLQNWIRREPDVQNKKINDSILFLLFFRKSDEKCEYIQMKGGVLGKIKNKKQFKKKIKI